MFARSFISGAVSALLLVLVPAAVPDVAASSPLRFDGCEQQIGVFPIDASAVTLPPGFRPIPFQDSSPAGDSGMPAPPGATATVQLTATSCARSSANGRPSPVSVLQAWLYVEPPPHLRADGIDAYLVVPWMMVSDPKIVRSLERLGLPAAAGPVTNQIERTEQLVARGTVDANRGTRRVLLETVVPTVARDTRPERLRLFGVQGQLVTGTVDFVEDEHTHVLVGTARLRAHGDQSFPVPSNPGVALYVERGYGVTWIPIG